MPTNRGLAKKQATTYATFLLKTAYEQGGKDGMLSVRDEIRNVAALVRGNVEIQAALEDPSYTPEQRASLARGTFAQCDPVLQEMLAVMAERGETGLLTRVVGEIENLLADKFNLCVVEVTTVVPLDDHLRELIRKKAETELGMSVELDERIDPSLIGGIIMSANGERIDASVSTQADNARIVLKQS